MTLVVDASVAVAASYSPDGYREFGSERLIAPPLLWYETHSVLHEMVWRGELAAETGGLMRERIARAPIAARSPKRLAAEAWSIAEELGWAKTYDAHYVALARIARCKLVTLDARLHRRVRGLGLVVAPAELRDAGSEL